MAAYRPPRTSRSSCLMGKWARQKRIRSDQASFSCHPAQFSSTTQTRMPRFHWAEQVTSILYAITVNKMWKGAETPNNSHSGALHTEASRSKPSSFSFLSEFLDCPSGLSLWTVPLSLILKLKVRKLATRYNNYDRKNATRLQQATACSHYLIHYNMAFLGWNTVLVTNQFGCSKSPQGPHKACAILWSIHQRSLCTTVQPPFNLLYSTV